jgi:hypothetical protein
MSTLLAILLVSAAPSASVWRIIIIGASIFHRESTERFEVLSS